MNVYSSMLNGLNIAQLGGLAKWWSTLIHNTARRGDRTVQVFAAKHQVHPRRVSGWKRQAQDGLKEVFARGTNHRQGDHEAVVHDLHAKIGELTVERDFLSRGLGS